MHKSKLAFTKNTPSSQHKPYGKHTIATTDIYSHFLKSSDRTAAKKIEELFD